MAWIKRNLIFVITIVVGLGVTGYCGYLLYAGLADNETARGQYESAKSGLEAMQNKTPYPTPENLQLAQADAVRVRAFLADFQKCFAGFPTPPKLGDRAFKDYLQKSLQRFRVEATNAGVELPIPDYAFSFSQQLDKLDYPPECIDPWMQQLEEIQAVLHILYDAKIRHLERIKRPATGVNDLGGGDEIFVVNASPNTWGTVSSYEVEFRAFSAEIASVLAGIAGSSNCFIVKTIYVSPNRAPLPQVAEVQPAAAAAPAIQYSRPAYVQPQPRPGSYGGPGGPRGRPGYGGGRPMMTPPRRAPVVAAAAAAQPVVPAGPETILREMPLFVTIYVDLIKLNEPAAPASAAKPRMKAP